MNNAVGYARPARSPNPVVLGTDGIGADMLEEFRLAYVAPAGRRRDADARHGVVVARGRATAFVPEARDDRVTWSYDHADSPWHVAFTPGIRAARRRRVDGEVAAARRRGRRASTPPRSGPRPPSRPPACSPRL